MAPSRERDLFVEHLRSSHKRITAERLAMFDEIFRQHGHIDAERLHEAMQRKGLKISRATVYRNLDLLVECDLVRRQRFGRRRFLYEHVHTGQHHDHLVCRRCGRLVEFVSPGIRALQREICRAHQFDPGAVTVQISSLCSECPGEAEIGVLEGAPEES
jgi:Fur family transcriptional regulator, ferric uptake regulator